MTFPPFQDWLVTLGSSSYVASLASLKKCFDIKDASKNDKGMVKIFTDTSTTINNVFRVINQHEQA